MIVLLFGLACTPEPVPPAPAPAPQPEPEAAPPPPAPERQPANLRPQVQRVTLSPDQINTNTDIVVLVEASDPEGVPLELDYHWTLNGRELIEERNKSLSHTRIKKGDEVSLRVEANDGVHMTEKSVTTTVGNAHPTFIGDPRDLRSFDGYQVRATDPDDDPLIYRLAGEPRGMTIDPQSGMLRYTGSLEEPGGDYTIRIIAEDEDEGQAIWEVSISISAGSQAAAQ